MQEWDFMKAYVEAEYKTSQLTYDFSLNNNELWDGVNQFLEKYVLLSLRLNYSHLEARNPAMTEEERSNFLNKVLCQRNLFHLERYEQPTYDIHLVNQGVKGPVTVFYTSDDRQGSEGYYFRRFFVAEANHQLAIVAIQLIKDISTKNYGKFEGLEEETIAVDNLIKPSQVIKISPPTHPDDLKFYKKVKAK